MSLPVRPKKSLGQNFLLDNDVLEGICHSVVGFFCECFKKLEQKIPNMKSNIGLKNIFEIGPGLGVLTEKLIEKGCHVVAIEKDERAYKHLQEHIGQKCTLIQGDVLQYNPSDLSISPLLCFGNIPYYITTPILFWFVEHRDLFLGGVFMMQKEVAERLLSVPGTKDYGRLSVKMQLQFDMKILSYHPREQFTPAPQVDSALVSFIAKEQAVFLSKKEEDFFERMTAIFFSSRRKMIRKTVENHWKINEGFWETLYEQGITSDLRPDVISPLQYLFIYSVIKKENNNP